MDSSNNKYIELLNTRIYPRTTNIPTGIGKYMDIILLKKDCIIYNKPLNIAKTIFINTRFKSELIIYFIDNILEQLKKPVNIIIAGEDFTFPNNIDIRDSMKSIHNRLQDFRKLGQHKMINKLFVENLDEDIENAIPIPLGIDPDDSGRPTNINYYLQFENIDENKPLKVTNFNRWSGQGQWQERMDVLNLCKTNWSKFFIPVNITRDHKKYLKIMGSYLFTICVHGGGLDVNPKLWEALLIGVIPIIRENKPYTDIYVKLNLPVVIVKKWDVDIINEKNLIIWYNKYYNYFTNNIKRKQMLNIFLLDYWVNYVNKF
jgi:hypothetical protein